MLQTLLSQGHLDGAHAILFGDILFTDAGELMEFTEMAEKKAEFFSPPSLALQRSLKDR